MKICHVTSAHNTLDDRIFVRECTSLAKKRENKVFIVGPGEDVLENGVIIIGCGEKPGSRIKRTFFYTFKVVKKALELNADIYHIHDPELLLFAMHFKRKGKKVIYDSHEFYRAQILTKTYIPFLFRKIIATSFGSYENYVAKRIDAVIFPCKIDGKHPFEGIAKRCCFIDNRPTFDEFPEESSTSYDKNNKYVCCAGGLSEARGIETLVEACYIANTPLVLAGSFSSEAFKNKILGKKEFEIVDYRGQCSREEVRDIYKKAYLGVSNILWEGQYPYIENLPTKVYEYMMMSLPFIISDFPYSKHIVEKNQCGIAVNPGDPVEIANSIIKLVQDEKLATEMGKKGKQLVVEQLNWNNEEQKLYELYESIVFNKNNAI